MSILYNLPFVTYELQTDEKIIMSDLSRRVALFKEARNDERFYVEYEVKDSETAEAIADRFYDDVDYDVLIYAMNDIVNPLEEWPMSYNAVVEYSQAKYADINDIHHYESITTGEIVDVNWPGYDRQPVTNIEYEVSVNDSKRDIKLLTPDYANIAYKQLKALLRG